MLQAYFDESERPNGLFCVAGYAFSSKDARRFIRNWDSLFGEYGGFHMKEFAHRKGRFSEISQDQRDELMRKAVHLINIRMSAGAVVSCNIHEIKVLSPNWIHGFSSAYSVCCHWAMHGLLSALRKTGNPDRIIYTFEAGHPHESEARTFLERMVSVPEIKEFYRHSGDAFLPKEDAVPLQAADLLAWEWAKCLDESLTQRKRPIRKSLLALLKHSPNRYHVAHVTGERLAIAMRKYTKLGIEQLEEERQEREAKKQSGIH